MSVRMFPFYKVIDNKVGGLELITNIFFENNDILNPFLCSFKSMRDTSDFFILDNKANDNT